MTIIIGSDHRGFALKEAIKKHFASHTWRDVGTDNESDRVDYPVFAEKVCRGLLNKEADLGILLCGSGIGVSIAANRFPGIYAALCWSPEVAASAREHDKANVLALGADFITESVALGSVQAWLEAEFLGGRYEKRLEMVDALK